MNKILIIGKTPPPIGGVTIHVQRLIDTLKKSRIKFQFEQLSKKNILSLMYLTLTKRQIIHLHASSPFIRFVFTFLGFISRSEMIITFHGNLGRFNFLGNWFDKSSIKLSSIPIVLNAESLCLAQSLNSQAILIPAFIPPVKEEILPEHIITELRKLEEKYSLIFCTHAFNLTYDKNKNEIYCGSLLAKIFSKKENQKYSLVFSDPSGSYKHFFEMQQIKLTKNINLISEPHSFFEILKFTDCFIRATTTDGDPLSIKEALYLNKQVIASDVIKRPSKCLIFNLRDTDSLQKLIDQINKHSIFKSNDPIVNGANEIIKLYRNLFENEPTHPRP
ncbi:hypothetical protein [Gaoshiqia sp. Z1-71]|uniref:hypothetical protein n=1 Tax=Gaoshiqia hydrogeniformans TaxID=3290090 RepID=UPI003BF8C01A